MEGPGLNHQSTPTGGKQGTARRHQKISILLPLPISGPRTAGPASPSLWFKAFTRRRWLSGLSVLSSHSLRPSEACVPGNVPGKHIVAKASHSRVGRGWRCSWAMLRFSAGSRLRRQAESLQQGLISQLAGIEGGSFTKGPQAN